MSRTVDTFAFGGGLDTNSAALAVPPGAVIAGLNYEALAEGYGRNKGYERFDGREAPSAVTWHALAFDAGESTIAQGNTITGATSGATAKVAADPALDSGTWGGGDAAGTLILVGLSGTFQDNETLTVGGTDSAVANGTAEAEGAPNDTLRQERKLLAQAYRRSEIAKPAGEGPVRGVAVHDGTVYCWRNNVGSTALVCHRATSSGWVAMETLVRLGFDAGSAEMPRGATVTGATSGATGVVADYVITGGAWADLDAVGWLILKTVTGTFQNNENIQIGGVTKAVANGAPVSQALGPNGRVRWLSHNFYGASNLYRLYGCTGEDKAFELIPGAGMALVTTGMPVDKPIRVFEISNHLGLCFPGGSIQMSSTLEPQIWSATLGAGEIGFGTEVTDVLQANETAVAFFGQNRIGILQGHDSTDFVLDILTEEAGAEPDTAQRIARSVYLDRRGLRSLDATQAYGNFKTGSLSERIELYFRAKRSAGATPIGTYVCKSKSQYRLVWDDGTGLSVYMGGKTPEAMLYTYDDEPFCFGAGELSDDEGIFFGGADGYVYRLESGNSYDGEPITAYIQTGFNHFGAASRYDRFFKVELELEAPGEASISVTVQYNYSDSSQPITGQQDFAIGGGGGLWNVAEWNRFNWSAPVESRAEAYVDGLGRNASFIFSSNPALDEDPHILSAYVVHRSPRKLQT